MASRKASARTEASRARAIARFAALRKPRTVAATRAYERARDRLIQTLERSGVSVAGIRRVFRELRDRNLARSRAAKKAAAARAKPARERAARPGPKKTTRAKTKTSAEKKPARRPRRVAPKNKRLGPKAKRPAPKKKRAASKKKGLAVKPKGGATSAGRRRAAPSKKLPSKKFTAKKQRAKAAKAAKAAKTGPKVRQKPKRASAAVRAARTRKANLRKRFKGAIARAEVRVEAARRSRGKMREMIYQERLDSLRETLRRAGYSEAEIVVHLAQLEDKRTVRLRELARRRSDILGAPLHGRERVDHAILREHLDAKSSLFEAFMAEAEELHFDDLEAIDSWFSPEAA